MPLIPKFISKTQIKKFDPNQPREAAGTSTGGQFASIHGVVTHGITGKPKFLETSEEGAAWIGKHREAEGHEPGSRTNPIHCGADIEKAAKLISSGQHVTLNQPDQVCTLVEKIKRGYEQAIIEGKKPPVWNIAAVSVKGTNLFAQDNLGIPRVEMPQLGGRVHEGSRAAGLLKEGKTEVDLTQTFIDFMLKSGVTSQEVTIAASHLRATQSQIDGAKIGAIAGLLKAGKLAEATITVTKDNYVLDGHHRWAGTIVNDLEDNHPGDLSMKANKLNIDIGTALSRARAFQEEWGIESAHLGKKQDFFAVLNMRALRLA